MDSSPATSSILDTLRTVEFRLGLKGYNVDEVDEYLDRAAQEAEAIQETIRQLNERLRQAGDRIVQLEREVREGASAAAAAQSAAQSAAQTAAPAAPAPSAEVVPAPPPAPVPAPAQASLAEIGPSDETLQRTLLLAQKFVDQVKRESEAEAAATVTQAEQTARSTLAAAEHAAMTLQTESERHVREEVARLEATRTELATDVESMARHLEAERNRLRDALTEILTWVDENVQPANSLMGVRQKAGTGQKPGAPAIAATPNPNGPAADGDDQRTMNLQSVAEGSENAAPRPL
jgi:DivIVA domain-containing protein